MHRSDNLLRLITIDRRPAGRLLCPENPGSGRVVIPVGLRPEYGPGSHLSLLFGFV